MYTRKSYIIDGIPVLRIGNENGVYMDLIPRLGAMVYQICLDDGAGEIHSILKNDAADELVDNPWFRGRLLFPFNDRIPGGRYTYDGVGYQLPINSDEDHSSIHGLVYDKNFSETECELSEQCGTVGFSLSIDKGDFPSYPFSVELKVTYTISSSDFSVSFDIGNRGDKTLPVALGWHPYFSLSPKVDTLLLKNRGKSFVDVDESLNPTGEVKSVSGTSLDFSKTLNPGSDELDIALTAAEDGRTSVISESHQLEIFYDPRFFPYTQFFIPPQRDSIAIEPITAATNAFNIDGLGRIDLPAGEERSGSVKITLNRLA